MHNGVSPVFHPTENHDTGNNNIHNNSRCGDNRNKMGCTDSQKRKQSQQLVCRMPDCRSMQLEKQE